MRVAIVHDYLTQRGGAERVVSVIHTLFPEAPIYTSILDRERLWPEMAGATIRTSWMQRLPGIRRHFKKYFPLYPHVFDRMDLRGYDLVLSSSSTFAKGVRRPPGAVHVCYCHGPTRFLWDRDRYLEGEGAGRLGRALATPLFRRLERWDREAALRPDVMIANSHWIASRIREVYGRETEVVHPPVDTDRFAPGAPAGGYYLVLARLVGYKRVDLAVTACLRLGRRLMVAGDGPARAELESLGEGKIEFIGRPSEAQLPGLYAGATAFLLGAEEDFGITMVEANAAGRPVLAFGRGGAREIVQDGVNGLLFEKQDTESLAAAIRRCEAIEWNSASIAATAARFSRAMFEKRYLEVVNGALRRSAEAGGLPPVPAR
jgi:glycosyltransferase involved in cell wall biosynthesis